MKDAELTIEKIRECLKRKNVYWTNHCLNRLNQRAIRILDVEEAIKNGRIIEYYYEDYPYPSCLILGFSLNNILLHVVCGVSNEFVHMITAYYPNINKWEDDMKIRRME